MIQVADQPGSARAELERDAGAADASGRSNSWNTSGYDGTVRPVARFPAHGGVWILELMTMDRNRIQGNWKQAQGKIKEKWGKLTDDDLTTINGQREQLEGIIEKRYGLAKDKVRNDVDAWLKSQS